MKINKKQILILMSVALYTCSVQAAADDYKLLIERGRHLAEQLAQFGNSTASALVLRLAGTVEQIPRLRVQELELMNQNSALHAALYGRAVPVAMRQIQPISTVRVNELRHSPEGMATLGQLRADALIKMGHLYYSGTDGFECDKVKARDNLCKALEEPELPSIDRADALAMLGGIYYDEGHYTKSAECLKQALDMPELDRDVRVLKLVQIGYMYYNSLGVERDDTRALRYFQQALAMPELTQAMRAKLFAMVGEIYSHDKGLEGLMLARDYVQKALGIPELSAVDRACALAVMGDIYYQAGCDDAEAVNYFKQALAMPELNQEMRDIAHNVIISISSSSCDSPSSSSSYAPAQEERSAKRPERNISPVGRGSEEDSDAKRPRT